VQRMLGGGRCSSSSSRSKSSRSGISLVCRGIGGDGRCTSKK
jgi:hypothetical protein